ncbi:MAG: DUF4293 domain-containing protein [Flavobacteriales bacterium]|nr:DUF4293 domain-containing protein [Flavobacteriales bacterium]MCB9192593.1 DUF4293 domain-containing protein [Flavobacteriales bacterium]
MIQRIQTVYLGIVAVLLMLPIVLEFSLATLAIEGGIYNLSPVTVSWMTGGATETVFGSYSIAVAFGLSLFLTVYAIFQFKNRKFQMRLIQLAMLLQPIIGAIVFIYADKMAKLSEDATVSYSPVLAVLLLNVLLYYLALRGVKKDDALVRSADRLR